MLKIIIVAMSLTGTLATAAWAQGAQVTFGSMRESSGEPVEVTADNLQINQGDGTAIYTGNVVIGQGDMRLAAPRVRVVYQEGAGRISRLVATGGVTLVSGEEAAEAEEADYDIERGTVVMTGNVLLTQGENAIASERMEVDLDNGTAQMTGRVRTLLQTEGDGQGEGQ